MVLSSITHIHLAWILYVQQSNNINICKLDLEALFIIYLNWASVMENIISYIPPIFSDSVLTFLSTPSETQYRMCACSLNQQHFES